jgi:hypothetical protein
MVGFLLSWLLHDGLMVGFLLSWLLHDGLMVGFLLSWLLHDGLMVGVAGVVRRDGAAEGLLLGFSVQGFLLGDEVSRLGLRVGALVMAGVADTVGFKIITGLIRF